MMCEYIKREDAVRVFKEQITMLPEPLKEEAFFQASAA